VAATARLLREAPRGPVAGILVVGSKGGGGGGAGGITAAEEAANTRWQFCKRWTAMAAAPEALQTPGLLLT
jgi:hypothetical protein